MQKMEFLVQEKFNKTIINFDFNFFFIIKMLLKMLFHQMKTPHINLNCFYLFYECLEFFLQKANLFVYFKNLCILSI